MKSDLTWPQQKEWIDKALTQHGFEKFSPDAFRKDDFGVDLTTPNKPIICRIVGGKRVLEDPDNVLAPIRQIVEDARDGIIRDTATVIQRQNRAEGPTAPTQASNLPEQKSVSNSSVLELIRRYVGNDLLEVFGDTGSGKSKFVLEVARQAIAEGKKVFYLDTERNLTENDVKSLNGCEYRYTPILSEIDQIVQRLPSIEVVILDSIGFPVLTSYARLSLKQKGDALLKLIAIFGDLKAWAYKNNGFVIVTNQPESEFNKEPGHILRPFGDKSQFAAKEIWKTEIKNRNSTVTNIDLSAFRSRSKGYNTKIATIEISDTGVKVEEVVK